MASTDSHGNRLKSDDVDLKVATLQNLPFDILDQVINDLPFDVVLELIQTKNRHITESIRLSTAYKDVFSGIENRADLEAVADIIRFCYEVSVYRKVTSNLCHLWQYAHKAGIRIAYVRKHDQHCPGNRNGQYCTEDSRAPYKQGSVRGARWDHTLFQKDKNPYVVSFTSQSSPTQENWAANFRIDRIATAMYDFTEHKWDLLFTRIATRIAARLQVESRLRFQFTRKNDVLLSAIGELLVPPKEREVVVEATEIAEGISNYISGIQFAEGPVFRKLIAPFEQLLMDFQAVEFSGNSSQGRGIYYTVAMPSVKDIFLEEILKYIIQPALSKVIIRKLEGRIYQVLQRAPASSYWFFHDYFNQEVLQTRRLKKVMFSEMDHKIFDDSQFWWDSLQAAFRLHRSKQLLELADLIDKYPYMLIKDIDPGPCARVNAAHIKRNLVSRAKKLAHYDPFQPRHYNARSLMRCPGLPFLPLEKHLLFFLGALTQNPICLHADIDSQDVETILESIGAIEAQYQIPRIAHGELQAPASEHRSGSSELHGHTAEASPSRSGDTDKSNDDRWPGNHVMKQNLYNDEIYPHIITVLQGLPIIYRKGSREHPPPRVDGKYMDQSLRFVRWRYVECQYIDINPDEESEPFHDKDIEWLTAFLKCCEYFKNNFTPAAESNHEWNILSASGPVEIPSAEKEPIVQARNERKMRKEQNRIDRRYIMRRKAKHAEWHQYGHL